MPRVGAHGDPARLASCPAGHAHPATSQEVMGGRSRPDGHREALLPVGAQVVVNPTASPRPQAHKQQSTQQPSKRPPSQRLSLGAWTPFHTIGQSISTVLCLTQVRTAGA